jgi:hypothetical protein
MSLRDELKQQNLEIRKTIIVEASPEIVFNMGSVHKDTATCSSTMKLSGNKSWRLLPDLSGLSEYL